MSWNKGLRQEQVVDRTARWRATVLKSTMTCELEHIGGCSADLQVHHVDGDPQNNALTNLMRLCRSHHRLLENGRIDLDNPVMPRFRIISGKRRYEYTYPYKQRATFWADA